MHIAGRFGMARVVLNDCGSQAVAACLGEEADPVSLAGFYVGPTDIVLIDGTTGFFMGHPRSAVIRGDVHPVTIGFIVLVHTKQTEFARGSVVIIGISAVGVLVGNSIGSEGSISTYQRRQDGRGESSRVHRWHSGEDPDCVQELW